jgi:hypothetical protein
MPKGIWEATARTVYEKFPSGHVEVHYYVYARYMGL